MGKCPSDIAQKDAPCIITLTVIQVNSVTKYQKAAMPRNKMLQYSFYVNKSFISANRLVQTVYFRELVHSDGTFWSSCLSLILIFYLLNLLDAALMYKKQILPVCIKVLGITATFMEDSQQECSLWRVHDPNNLSEGHVALTCSDGN